MGRRPDASGQERYLSPDAWSDGYRGRGREIHAGIKEYDNTVSSLVRVVRPFVQLGLDIHVRRPGDADPDQILNAEQFYGKATDLLIQSLVPNEERRRSLDIPDQPTPEEFQATARRLFGGAKAGGEQLGRISNPEERMRLLGEISAHLARLGTLVFSRVPEALQQQTGAYQKFYRDTLQSFLDQLDTLAATTVDQPSAAPTTETAKPAQGVLRPLDPEIIALIDGSSGMLADFSESSINVRAVDALPENVAASESTSGSRAEQKGGHEGRGVTQRFQTWFLSPLDSSHPRLSGISPEYRDTARRAEARKKALAEIVCISFLNFEQEPVRSLVNLLARGSGVETDRATFALVRLLDTVRNNTELGMTQVLSPDVSQYLRRMVDTITSYELQFDQNPTLKPHYRFFSIGSALVRFGDDYRKNHSAQRLMNLMIDIFRDERVRMKLGIEPLLGNG